ncbi:BQ2448_7286 [Microbotryum intermedium]|uniref:BQ2448_7286 protein n=1 Tax=Microbotryum intermedium TaxID=269621 RepID=A0A238FHR5_9BASI|nr:BQ2448_7286 [Microbotryum intermedium]
MDSSTPSFPSHERRSSTPNTSFSKLVPRKIRSPILSASSPRTPPSPVQPARITSDHEATASSNDRLKSLSSQMSEPDLGARPSLDHVTSTSTALISALTAVTDEKAAPAVKPLNLLKLASSVVQSRNGSVLSRGYIVKRDYRPIHDAASPSTLSTRPDQIHLTGADNFRGVDDWGVYGLAQPTETGLRTVLSMLRAQDTLVVPISSSGAAHSIKRKGRHVVWFCTREEPIIYLGAQPFVLRDAAHPTRTYSISDRAENLEEIEKRLKVDILKEAQRYGGVILVQEEIRPLEIVNCWIAADSVRTVRELWEEVIAAGYNLSYHRTPVTADQSPEDGYLDTYSELIRDVPTSSLLVFNCGIGVVRTTFAMTTAILVRRMQRIKEGQHDLIDSPTQPQNAPKDSATGATNAAGDPVQDSKMLGLGKARSLLKEKKDQAERDKSLLRLMTVLQTGLVTRPGAGGQGAMLGLLLAQPQLLENLRTALVGQYDLILSLLSVIDDAQHLKQIVDTIIDRVDFKVNLRESILEHRIRYASLALVDNQRHSASHDRMGKALAALERYFFLIAFAAFINDAFSDSSTSATPHGGGKPTERRVGAPIKFSMWLKERTEIGKMLARLKKTGQGHFWVFSPIQDLSAIARGEAGQLTLTDHNLQEGGGGQRGEGDLSEKLAQVQRKGNQVVGDEWAQQIVRNRAGIILRPGMILKNDQWRIAATDTPASDDASSSGADGSTIRGAINFRRIPDSSLYGLSQPSQDGIVKVLEEVRRGMVDPQAAIVWINLREEPLVYINGTPYVLRQESISLRNVKSYAGISSTRLELLEDRLKSDILNELKLFEGRLLLHTEEGDGSVHPVWEVVQEPFEGSVKTLREIFTELQLNDKRGLVGPAFEFMRIPITAERPPHFQDVQEIIEIVVRLPVDETALIVNCQLGRGRSTRAQIIITLVQKWMRSKGQGWSSEGARSTRYSYTVINNLLRTIRSGQEVKAAVDEAIDACRETYDLLDSIEEARQQAEDAKDHTELRSKLIAKGLQSLRSYYFLIIFSAFLNECKAETWNELRSSANSYESWVRERPVFKTIERELDSAGIEALMPLEKPVGGTEGHALSDEVQAFVAKRSGRILSAFTLLKSDFFSGLQKMSLPERVEGAPNFRRVRLSLETSSDTSKDLTGSISVDPTTPLVYGSGMPTVEGLRRALERMGAKEKPIVWTSMREEPVIYVNGGRPHVLRLIDEPLENVITTGVTAATVEAMEVALQRDLRKEAEENDGKILLHDEVAENGNFIVTAFWESVHHNDILTPKEVFALMRQEGFQVDYERLPVTDEQAPLAGVYTRLEQRVISGVDRTSNFVFNCQMASHSCIGGSWKNNNRNLFPTVFRVAATLVYNILFDDSLASSHLTASVLLEPPNGADDPEISVTWDGHESDPYISGEYKIVLQLVSLLEYGKLAKKLVDRAIDACEGVQNLRRAVYDFKLRAEASDAGSKKHRKIFGVAVNYLYRYASLIVFASYLLEKVVEDEDTRNDSSVQAGQSFNDWLAERREISSVLSRRSLE